MQKSKPMMERSRREFLRKGAIASGVAAGALLVGDLIKKPTEVFAQSANPCIKKPPNTPVQPWEVENAEVLMHRRQGRPHGPGVDILCGCNGCTCGYECINGDYVRYHNGIMTPNTAPIVSWGGSADNIYLMAIHHQSAWYDYTDSESDLQSYSQLAANYYGWLSGAAPTPTMVNNYIARCNAYGFYPSYQQAFNILNTGTATSRQQGLNWVNGQSYQSTYGAAAAGYRLARVAQGKSTTPPDSYPDQGDPNLVQDCSGYDAVVTVLAGIALITAIGGPLTIEISVTTGVLAFGLGVLRPMVC